MIQSFISTALVLLLSIVAPVNARNYNTRGGARTNVNQNANINRNVNQNVNRNVNVNQNVNVNRNVNVNVHGGYYGGGCCGCCYNEHPVATAAAVTAAAVTTAAIVGSVVHTLPPSCTTVMSAGVTYQHCGSSWYQPQFVGGSTTYVVVNGPN
jgi:hypothetical protein